MLKELGVTLGYVVRLMAEKKLYVYLITCDSLLLGEVPAGAGMNLAWFKLSRGLNNGRPNTIMLYIHD